MPPCVPGVELAHRIRAALNHGRPGCWVGQIPGTRLALGVPRATLHRYEELTTNDRVAGNRFYAAALRDLLGLDYEAIAYACGYAGDTRERTARRAVQVGRRLWHEVGAWPWFYFAAPGRPPSGWSRHGGSSQLDATFWTWATGCFHIPLTGGGARAVDPDTPWGARSLAA